MGGLSHQRVYHQIWGVGFDDLCSLGFADYMALRGDVLGMVAQWTVDDLPCRLLDVRMPWPRSTVLRCNLHCLLLQLPYPFALLAVSFEGLVAEGNRVF